MFLYDEDEFIRRASIENSAFVAIQFGWSHHRSQGAKFEYFTETLFMQFDRISYLWQTNSQIWSSLLHNSQQRLDSKYRLATSRPLLCLHCFATRDEVAWREQRQRGSLHRRRPYAIATSGLNYAINSSRLVLHAHNNTWYRKRFKLFLSSNFFFRIILRDIWKEHFMIF